MSGRIARRFAALGTEGRGGLVTFLTAGDPEPEISANLIAALPAAARPPNSRREVSGSGSPAVR